MRQLNMAYRLRVRTAIKELNCIKMRRGLTKSQRTILKQLECIILG